MFWPVTLCLHTKSSATCPKLLKPAIAILVLMIALCASGFAQGPDMCTGGTLDAGAPLGQPGPDLVVTNMTCTVDGSHATYNFHNVYIFGNGKLTFNEANITFYAANILVQNQGTLQATGIGTTGKTLTIHLYGPESDPGVTCKKMDGQNLVDDPTCGVPDGSNGTTDVWNSNQMNMMNPTSCRKTSQLDPPTLLPGGIDDCFYQYTVFDRNDGPGAYFGHKVLAVAYGGTIKLSGYKGAQGGDDANPAVTGTSWMRLNATLTGGGTESSLQVSGAPSDWQPNDYIVVTATDYLPGHAEKLQVASVSGSTVNLKAAVQDPHWGQVYSLAKVPCNNETGSLNCDYGPDLLPGQTFTQRNVDVRAAVGLLTRSIRIVSDGDTANAPFTTGYYGGHTVILQGILSYQAQGVEFYQLGQGGSKGHYPVHFHMARHVPDGTYVKDCSIWDSMTRWITVHATQHVTLARNVGYLSIGHGFYLEDGSEADNTINTNLGVFARAAVVNGQNPRNVPGILAEPGRPPAPPGMADVFHSDWEAPAVFWIMNAWNDFQYNYASSAGTCGACYWLLPGAISGPSQKEFFEGYAGQQVVTPHSNGLCCKEAQWGYTPLKSFVGNSCSVAMESFINIGQASACNGVSNNGATGFLQAVPNSKAPVAQPVGMENYYPIVTGLRKPTVCTDMSNCGDDNPTVNPQCIGTNGKETTCAVTVLERYTTSFNWAEKNFSAIWLRPWWFLVENSAITDVQQGGITFVTGGGYTRSDIAQGFWSLLQKSVLIGNTQSITGHPSNGYADSEGPFNPNGLTKCDNSILPGFSPAFCLSAAQGISYPADSFLGNQRLINIYDGPSYQEKNAFLDIPVSRLGTQAGNCETTGDGTAQNCPGFKNFASYTYGIPQDRMSPGSCYLPNAAIAWKQSNGFFYPPAFHSQELYFSNVDIRHFVIEPEFNFGTFTTNFGAVKKRYCSWSTQLFNNYTDIDRQTILNDDDGSLTGLLGDLGEAGPRETISVNEDPFFLAPTVTVECASDVHKAGTSATDPPATANTSPYEYITTATIAKCGISNAGCRQNGWGGDCSQQNGNQYCAWGDQCGSGSGPQACYGVPLYRQYLTDTEYANYISNPMTYQRPQIRMMGQGNGQRSTLTVNHGIYYIDDQVTKDQQDKSGAHELNVYMPGVTYYTYFIYAKADMNQTYLMYVGKNLNENMVKSSVVPYRVQFNTGDLFQFNQSTGESFLNVGYDKDSGLASITVHLDAYASEFTSAPEAFCQPTTYCSYNATTQKCGCAAGTNCTDDNVCKWGTKDIDCPLTGCFAFGITMPASFETGQVQAPAPTKFTNDPNYAQNWGIPWDLVEKSISGAQCHYTAQPN